MASSYVETGVSDENGKKLHNASPRNTKKMHWSSGSPTYSNDHSHNGTQHMCVCAPATHAGSFKCRLHRVNPQAPLPPSPPMPRQTSGAAMVSKTVEAQ